MGKFKFRKLYDVKSPMRGTDYSAGIDFYIPEYTKEYADTIQKYVREHRIVVPPLGNVVIPSGLKVSYPKNRALQFINRSSIASRNSLVVGAELCDWDYMHELFFDLHNITDREVYVDFGQKIIQAVIIPVYFYDIVECFDDQKLFGKRRVTRTGGFGSTGK